ncbi:hypothetical protein ACHWQZ_G013658 [Mnemiopsis leidyi]
MICVVCAISFLVLFARLLYVLFQVHYNDTSTPLHRVPPTFPKPVRLLAVAGSGGHTAELLQLLAAATAAPSSKSSCLSFSTRHYIVAKTDSMSQDKIEQFETTRNTETSVVISKIPRAREVGQSYLTSILTTVYSQLFCIPHVLRARPDILLVNGPGTCIPVCVFVFLLRVLGLCRGKIVYVESICRVNTLSLSAKILVFFADHVLVQWPQLASSYRCKYIGRLVS